MFLESIKAVEPDIEVTVRAGQQEIAVIGVFQNQLDTWDMVVGVDDVERPEQLITLFTAILAALPSATFGFVRTASDGQLSFLGSDEGVDEGAGRTNVNQDK